MALAGRSALVGVRDRVCTRNASCTPRLVHVSADGVLAAQLLTCNRAICPFLPFRALRCAARKWPVYRDFAMARPELEPGTPRFSDVGRNVSNSRVIPAIDRVSVIEAHWLDVRRLRSFLADSGTEMRIGTQCETAGARRSARGSWTTSACPSCRAWPLASPAPSAVPGPPASSWSFRLRGRGAGRRGRGRSAPWRVAGCRSWIRGS
jgi:hypothetical protein